MRKMIMAMTALALSSGVAWGQGATQTVTLEATVGASCTIGNLTGPSRVVQVPFSNLKATGGNLNAIGTNGAVFCTSNATIGLSSANGGLTNSTAAGLAAAPGTGPFVNKIHYTAQANYSGQTLNIDTRSPTTQSDSKLTGEGAQSGATLALSVNIIATDTSKYLVDGLFQDTLTVTLTPTP
jgi:hypothetical protein